MLPSHITGTAVFLPRFSRFPHKKGLQTGTIGVIIPSMLLSFKDNSIIDLSDRKKHGELEIVDIMKTMDNRYVFDTKKVKDLGMEVDEPEYV